MKRYPTSFKVTMSAMLGLSLGAFVAFLPLPGISSAQAASFNCGKTNLTGNEVTICDSHHLSAMDSRMVNLYYEELRGAQPSFVQEQHEKQERWLRHREKCGSDKACITKAYERRIHELEKFN